MQEDKVPTVAELFEKLGFGHPGVDASDHTRWALIELALRRKQDNFHASLIKSHRKLYEENMELHREIDKLDEFLLELGEGDEAV